MTASSLEEAWIDAIAHIDSLGDHAALVGPGELQLLKSVFFCGAGYGALLVLQGDGDALFKDLRSASA